MPPGTPGMFPENLSRIEVACALHSGGHHWHFRCDLESRGLMGDELHRLVAEGGLDPVDAAVVSWTLGSRVGAAIKAALKGGA